ncbi:MAG: HAD family hydrolase [Leptolyngbya sp.]|nr:HAD family hydrolase [Leptolyngbya sp.]
MACVQWGDRPSHPVGGIVWDKDGTLADSLPFLLDLAHRRAGCLEQQVPGVRSDLLKAWGAAAGLDPAGLMAVGTREDNAVAAAAYVAAQGVGWVAALDLAHQAFRAADQTAPHKASVTPPFPGIAALLAACHQAGIPMAVLSGDTTDHVQDFLHHYGLHRWITWSRGSDREMAKPNPRLLQQACDRLGVPADQVWVVGDSALDGVMARQGGAAGWISVTWGGSPPDASADGVVNSIADIGVQP